MIDKASEELHGVDIDDEITQYKDALERFIVRPATFTESDSQLDGLAGYFPLEEYLKANTPLEQADWAKWAYVLGESLTAGDKKLARPNLVQLKHVSEKWLSSQLQKTDVSTRDFFRRLHAGSNPSMTEPGAEATGPSLFSSSTQQSPPR